MKIQKQILVALGLIIGSFLTAQNHSSSFIVDLLTKKVITEVPSSKSIDDIYSPCIQVFQPTKVKSNGRAVVICPGGGYSMVTSGYEGSDWANYFNKLGIVTIVLKYRLPKGNYNIPIYDTEKAFKMVKDSAKVWNVNPDDVGIMGFSAGGHLAATFSTHIQPSLRPKFQLLFYPVITMDKTYTHIGSHDNFLGKDASKELENLYSNEKQVTKDTPPAFVVFAADDKVVPPANGINFVQALIDNDVSASLHIYPKGGHGWYFNNHYDYQEEILSELTMWLKGIK